MDEPGWPRGEQLSVDAVGKCDGARLLDGGEGGAQQVVARILPRSLAVSMSE
jgi:hypothetical protein